MEESDIVCSAGGVVVSVVGSCFLPQLTAASAMVSDNSATITSAKFFRIVFVSPPLGPAAPALLRQRPVSSLVLSFKIKDTTGIAVS